MAIDKTKFPYTFHVNEVDTNTKMLMHYTKKGAELWDWLARRGFVALIPYAGHGYYYRFADLERGLKTAHQEGLTAKGGYFYEEKYYA